MSRPILRQSPALESLERREVLSGPGADAQYMLELVNLARTSPASIAQKINSSINANDNATLTHYRVNLQQELQQISSSTPRQPLAWSSTLADTATRQSQDQANMGVQTHSAADGADLNTRLDRAGLTQLASTGENAFAYSDSVDEAMKAFLIDWGVDSKGHRKNLLQPDADSSTSYNETGIGIVSTNNKGLGPLVITEDFARNATAKPYLLGVAFADSNNDRFYNPGEGRGGITIEARNIANGSVATTQTWDAGGYQLNLDPGDYQVTAKLGQQTIRTKRVSIGSENVKIDFNLADAWDKSAPSTPAPAPVAVAAYTPPAVVRAPAPVAKPVTPVAQTLAQVSNDNAIPTPVATTGTSLNSSLINPLGWITSWTSWKATNKTAS